MFVLESDNLNGMKAQYTWGLDLSRSVHGAGGVGGLLAAVETQGTSSTGDDEAYWFCYDGNGNVGQVLDASDRSTAAAYEYDPFGNPIRTSGSYAAPFDHSQGSCFSRLGTGLH